MKYYIRFVLNWPKSVIAACVIITLVMALGIFRLQFDTSVATFLPQSDPEYLYYNEVKEIYGDNSAFVILDVTHENLFHPSTFRQIDHLLTDMEAFQEYDAGLENERKAKAARLLADPEVTRESLLAGFGHDPAFQRLLVRKLDQVNAGPGELSRWKKSRLEKALAAADALKSREMIEEIISPFTIKDITGEDDMLTTIELIETDPDGRRILPETSGEFQVLVERLKRNPVFEKGIYAVDDSGRITDFAFIIRFADVSDSDPIAREILSIVDSYEDTLTIISQGEPVIYIWLNNYMQRDLSMLIPLVMLVVIIVFYLNFRTPRGVVLPFASLLMSMIWILGLMGYLGIKMTTVGVSIPVLMIAVGSSYAIHIVNQYYADYQLIIKEGQAAGLAHAMAHISTTVFLTGLTTFVAFLTLATHQLSAIREWGICSAVGIVFAVLISASLIPAGLELLPNKPGNKKVTRHSGVHSPMIDRLIHWMTRGALYHYKAVSMVILVVIGFSVAGLMQLKVETELLHYFKKDNPIRTSSEIISDKFGGRWGFDILVDSGEKDGIKSADFLRTISDIRCWLEACENDLCIGRTDAFPDFIKTMHMAMNNDHEKYFDIPDTNAEIMDYLEIYSDDDVDSDGRVDRFEPYVDPMFQTCNILTRLGQKEGELLGTGSIKRILTSVETYLENNLPEEYDFKITGHPSMVIKSVDYIVNGQIQSLLLTLVVIGIMVFILLRDMRSAMLSMIPMSVAVILNFGIMGWFGIRLDIATSIIAAITIGIGVDDTIHFLNTFRWFRMQGEDVDTAIAHTLKVAGKAIIFTSLALVFGFSVMLFSTFKPLMLFGLLMTLTMVATTIGALLVLPAALKLTGVRLVKADAVCMPESDLPAVCSHH